MLDQALNALGYVGSSLDKLGGRELRGLLGGKPREALSFVPFSDRLGITDPNDIVSGRNLTDKAGLTTEGDDHWTSHAAGIGAEMALNPALLLGGGIKAASSLSRRWDLGNELGTAGRLAAKRVNAAGAINPRFKPFDSRDLNNAADWLGPGYPPNRTIQEALNFHHGDQHNMITQVAGLQPEDLGRVIQEIPPGSKQLGHGAEAWTLKTPGPNPWAIRLGPETSPLSLGGEVNRPNIPGVLQPIRSNLYGAGGGRGVRVEHMPLVKTLADPEKIGSLLEELHNSGDPALEEMLQALGNKSYRAFQSGRGASRTLARQIQEKSGHSGAWDLGPNPSNLGWWEPKGGAPLGLTHDAGAIDPLPGSSIPRPYTPGPPAPEDIADVMDYGGNDIIRKILAEGSQKGLEGQGLASPELSMAVGHDKELRAVYNQAFAALMNQHAGIRNYGQGF